MSISYIFLKPNVVNDDNIGNYWQQQKYIIIREKKKKKKKKKMDIIRRREREEKESEVAEEDVLVVEGRTQLGPLFDYAFRRCVLRFCAHCPLA